MKRSARQTDTAVMQAIFQIFMATGGDADAKQIAERAGVSETTARRSAERQGSSIVTSRESRASYSTSYRGFQSGAHIMTVYAPSRSYLREVIRRGETP